MNVTAFTRCTTDNRARPLAITLPTVIFGVRWWSILDL